MAARWALFETCDPDGTVTGIHELLNLDHVICFEEKRVVGRTIIKLWYLNKMTCHLNHTMLEVVERLSLSYNDDEVRS